MTVTEAVINAAEKAALYEEAEQEERKLYNAHTEAEIAAKVALSNFVASRTKTNEAQNAWRVAQAELSRAILEAAKKEKAK